jgi:hypothetical protein
MFKNFLMAMLLALACNYFCGAMKRGANPSEIRTVIMPDAETLVHAFEGCYGGDFVESTDVVIQLAGKSLSVGKISVIKSLVLCDYSYVLAVYHPQIRSVFLRQAELAFDRVIAAVIYDQSH